VLQGGAQDEAKGKEVMVYIRAKSVRGDKYLYLVRSVWDSKNSTSRQEIIKYLGKASGVRPEDIPEDYRNNPRIEAFLATNAGGGAAENEKLAAGLRDGAFRALTAGDLDGVIGIYEAYSGTSGMAGFYDDVLKPTMYRIGRLWAQGRLGIADEHVASNVASELVSIISEKNSGPENRARVLICAPNGEEHSIGCGVLQSFLQSRGYRVFNLSPSAPSEAITRFVRESKPDIVLISITVGDNIRTGQRLVRKIREAGDVPVLVGGQALEGSGARFGCGTVANQPLEKILKAIRGELGQTARGRRSSKTAKSTSA